MAKAGGQAAVSGLKLKGGAAELYRQHPDDTKGKSAPPAPQNIKSPGPNGPGK